MEYSAIYVLLENGPRKFYLTAKEGTLSRGQVVVLNPHSAKCVVVDSAVDVGNDLLRVLAYENAVYTMEDIDV